MVQQQLDGLLVEEDRDAVPSPPRGGDQPSHAPEHPGVREYHEEFQVLSGTLDAFLGLKVSPFNTLEHLHAVCSKT